MEKENNGVTLLFNRIQKLERRQSKLFNQIDDLKIELQQICPHEEVIKQNKFIEGDYYDRSQYITTITCKVCGKQLFENIKYGGFS